MVASENTVAGDQDADGVLALPENVRQFAPSLPSGIKNLYMFGLLASNILSGMLKNVVTSLTLQQENEAFTRQMAAKSRKIVMDAEHGQMLDYFFVFVMESKGKGYART